MNAISLKTAMLDPPTWRRVNYYLDGLLDLHPAEREQWLLQLTDSDPAIAGLLDRLLAKPTTTCGFLEHSPLALMRRASSQPSMVGTQIRGYTIERLIGRGGMGTVWFASRSDGTFERHSAIKFVDTLPARPDLVERFAKEGRLLGRLSHPNIARLSDAGTTEGGRQFLVLEYVDGERIDNYCDAGNLTVEARVRLFLGAVAAVAHAHSHLIIHRDLKPSNVLVDREGTVKLLDFGIAKLLDGGEADEQGSHTRIEESVLTPDYAAPEQLLGDVPSTATDVYQLGMLLYVLLTGRHPLQPAATRSERIKAALDGDVPLASNTCEKSKRKQLRGDLDAILRRALDREPTRRYPTASALHEDLTRYLNREPVAARCDTLLYQIGKFITRHRVVVSVVAAAVAALCGALVFAVEQARLATVERDRAVRLFARNDAVNDFLGTLITEAAEADRPVTLGEMLARTERLARLDSSGSLENRAAVLGMIGGRYGWLGDSGKSAELLEQALALLKDEPADGLRAELRCGYALVISTMGRMDEAVQLITRELHHPPSNPTSRAECLRDRALIAIKRADGPGTLRYALQAMSAIRSSGAVSRQREAAFLDVLARGYAMSGRYDQALRSYERALQQFAEVGREWSPSGISARNNFAFMLGGAGVPRRALQLYDETLDVVTKRDPSGSPPVYLVINRSRMLGALGRFEQARAISHQALQIARQTRHTAAEVRSLIAMAESQIELGDSAAADQSLTQAIQLLGSRERISEFPAMYVTLGKLDLARGSLLDAETQFEQAAANTQNGSVMIEGLLGSAEVCLRRGDAKLAVTHARAGLHLATSLQGGSSFSQHTGRAWLILGRALQYLGDTAQARTAFASAVSNLSNTVDGDHPLLLQARNLAQSS